jgi:hypothetical protein
MIGLIFWLWVVAPGQAAAPPAAVKLLPLAGEARAGGRPLPPGRWSSLEAGDAIELGADVEAWLACSDGACRVLTGPLEIGDAACSQPTPPCCRRAPAFERSSRAIDAGGGTLQVCGQEGQFRTVGSGLLLGGPRGSQRKWGIEPVLIFPRCPELGREGRCEKLTRQPERIVFSEVSGAGLYLAVLLGSDGGRLEIPASAVACESWPSLTARICSHPWPADWRLPEAGDTFRLVLGAEVAGERRQGTPTRLQRLAATAANESGPASDPAAIAAWQSAGRWNELAEFLRRLPSRPSRLELALADAYLHLDLPELAETHFRKAADTSQPGEGLVASEAAIGRGLSCFELGRFDDALSAFRHAAGLAQSLGLPERGNEIAALIRRTETAAKSQSPQAGGRPQSSVQRR